MNKYIEEVDKKIDELKIIGIKSFYASKTKFSKSTKEEFKNYFESKKYNVEIRMCPRGLYDVIIQFPLDN
jgi:hypothetical protein